ncbi:MAG TPA: fibronectin type III domain-containing protein [Chloroflexota bacterium]|nr:fibronectin type III domain-containing protein [Chloroflexota bacterium]
MTRTLVASPLALLAFPLVVGATCHDEQAPMEPGPTPPAGAQEPAAVSQPAPPADERGLTFEENLRINPPPPANVRVALVEPGAIHLAWDPPPPVSLPHPYSDVVVAYRVFRRRQGELELQPLAETPATQYSDRAVSSGAVYEYAVASIRAEYAEGGRSDPAVSAQVP